MANVYQVDLEKINCIPHEVPVYLDIINGITVALSRGDYKEGCRNNMMVDLVCVLGLLGLPWTKVIDEMDYLGWFDDDDEYPMDRAERISEYDSQFSYGWMIDPASWIDTWLRTDDEEKGRLPIKFERW